MKPVIATLPPIAPDALLQLIGLFRDDPSPDKIDLGVGIYKDAQGQTPIFSAVREAHRRFSVLETSKAYLGPMGWPGFADQARDLILGTAAGRDQLLRCAAVPTPGGCGALRLAGEVVRRAAPDATVWMSDPTWANHKPTFRACGLTIGSYPYLDRQTGEVLFDAMMGALDHQVKAGDIILLHGCCHNPTGADLDLAQWQAITDFIVARGALALIDIAYHGLGDGMDADLAGARHLLAAVPEALVCYSFSKNMGLYRDRVGLVMYQGDKPESAAAVRTHILEAARQNYSMPPTYGEALAGIVLEDDDLRQQWLDELEGMRARVRDLRALAAKALCSATRREDLAVIARHKGMFSMLPLTRAQVTQLREEHSIYAAPDGRINVCGLSERLMGKFADAVAALID